MVLSLTSSIVVSIGACICLNMKTKELIEQLQALNRDAVVNVKLTGFIGRAREDNDDELKSTYSPALGGQMPLHPADIEATESCVTIQLSHTILIDVTDQILISGDISRFPSPPLQAPCRTENQVVDTLGEEAQRQNAPSDLGTSAPADLDRLFEPPTTLRLPK